MISIVISHWKILVTYTALTHSSKTLQRVEQDIDLDIMWAFEKDRALFDEYKEGEFEVMSSMRKLSIRFA